MNSKIPFFFPGLTTLVVLGAFTPLSLAAEITGKEIYLAKCATCHGPKGEGVKGKYAKKLNGALSISQLARVIQETMPEKDPGSLKLAEAEKIAGYIHSAFYFRGSRDANAEVRVELAHLTATQYQNAVADLIASFRTKETQDGPAGVQGEYFKGRNFNKGDKVLTRADPEIHFDFQINSPEPGKIDPYEFSIRWTGSLLPKETGIYDLVVRTDHAFRLWVNDEKNPLIDGWVKSGKETEFKSAIRLLGGRAYFLRLEFSKAKQGVNDSNKTPKPPVKPAFIKLYWKAPFGALEPIPSRNFLTKTNPEVFVLDTPFPPDDRSRGWERGVGFSSEWETAVREGALETAAYVTTRLEELAKAPNAAGDRKNKLRDFVKKLARVAFSSQWNPETDTRIDKIFQDNADGEMGVKKSLLLILMSPRFLYTRLPGADAKAQIASRLALGLWDSIPSPELLEKISTGPALDLKFLEATARQMMNDPRAKQKVMRFFHYLLNVEHIADIQKEKLSFPKFNDAVLADMRLSLDLFVDDVYFSPGSQFSELLLSRNLYLNSRLGDFLQTAVKPGAGFAKVPGDEFRSGIITHPYLLSVLAYPGESSPIHRGVFLARGMLGVGMNPPPEAVAPLAPDLHPSLSTRERVEMQTRPASCLTCHGIINPLGFTLEKYDAAGRFRREEKSKAINAQGSFVDRQGKAHNFSTPRELAQFISQSREAQEYFAENVFHHVTQQPLRAYGNETLQFLLPKEEGINMREIFIRAAVRDALGPVKTPQRN
ncbi:MAG: DUF1588 domain-containing protein [Gemmataceae bacterium]|nr:DUF1588 domain-containing protein [Gemmataceae bacterium]